VIKEVVKAPLTRNETIADSGSTKNLSYTKNATKPKHYEAEATIQLDADSTPRETGGTPRFKDKIRMTKEQQMEWPRSEDDETSKPKKKLKKSPAPK
jgi:hypothetical protein